MSTIENDIGLGIDYWAARTPERIALCNLKEEISYAELEDQTRRVASALHERGIRKDDTVLLSMPNTLSFTILEFAMFRIGAIVIYANPLYQCTELRHLIALTKPKLALVYKDRQIRLIQEADPQIPVLLINADTYHGLLRAKPWTAPFLFDKDRVAVGISTSGSTGRSKVVGIMYRNLLAAWDYIDRMHLDNTDVSYIPVPLCQSYGIMATMCAFLTGGGIAIEEKFSGETALELISARGVTTQFCVPVMYAREIDVYEKESAKPKLDTLKSGVIAGAPSMEKYIAWFDKTLNCRILNLYGLTECTALSFTDLNDSEYIRYHTAGRPCRHAQIRIVDEQRRDVAAEEVGELLCHGPGEMKGYIGEPALTQKAYTEDNWMITGDMGYFTKDGYLVISGRKKHMIIKNGYNVFPAEVEKVYSDHSDIADICVIGYKDECTGERIAAFVQKRQSSTLTEEALKVYGKKLIARYKIPDRFFFMDKLPRLINGKHDLQTMQSILADLLQQ